LARRCSLRLTGADATQAIPKAESAGTLIKGAVVPSTSHLAVDMVSVMTARSERRAVRLAWGIGLCALGLIVVSLVLLVLDGKAIDSAGTAQLPYFLQAPVVGIVGVLIAARRPKNPIGWLLLAIAVLDAVYLLADFIAMRGLLSGASPQSWVAWPALLFNATGLGGPILLGFLVLYFPDGHLPGRRWRWVAWFLAFAIVKTTVSAMIAVAPIEVSPRLPNVANPLAVRALDGLTNGTDPSASVALLAILLLVLAAAVVRFRRSQGVERRQLRWFAYTAAVSLVLLVVAFFLPGAGTGGASDWVWAAGSVSLLVVVPSTIGLAVMRYGLYDLDVFISRTLVYGSLAVFITAVYVGIAVGIGTLVGSGGKPNLALSILATAIVAIGFQPVRERVQRVANRLVYGQRATPYEVLSEFSGRVAETYAADEVLPRMARVLQEGTGAESATVWLRGNVELRPAATFPDAPGLHESLVMRNGTLPELPGATRAVEVRHQGELLGALSVNKRRGEALTPIEEKLVDDLAHQAGLVLKNVGLSADLQARLDELRASRQRLVSAQDMARRRLERNLHDGAQQHLVALKVKLGLAEMLLGRDPAKAAATLEQLKGDADEALETLRDLARGIYPPLLADKGLVVALESQARKATVPVRVKAEAVGRYPQEIEAALYFCTLEALQNVEKYAAASAVEVRLREEGGQVHVDVIDDGRGFDLGTVSRGAGLTNMEDRIDALGGSLHVASTPGSGTTLRATVPVPDAIPQPH
jgi:signal transduction histidine kinase